MKGLTKSINGKIILSFLGSLVVGILLLSVISTISAMNYANTTADLSSKELISIELNNLDQLAESKAKVVNEYFSEYIAQVTFLASFAEDLFNGRITADPVTSYYGDKSKTTDQSTPDMDFSAEHNIMVSYDASAYYMAGINSVENDLTDADRDLVDISSNLDYAFKILHEQNPSFFWSYMGFSTGLHRTYPYKDLSTWSSNTYTSARDGSSVVGYDPRIRAFYYNAETTGELNIPRPQTDPTLGILKISISMPVYYDNDTLIGVVGSDLTIDAVEETVSDLTILENGYAFLIDSEQYAVMHPDIDRQEGSQFVQTLEFDTDDDFDTIIDRASTQNIGSGTYEKGRDKWYASYYPVDSAEFSLVLVVPEDDVIAVANTVRSQIISQLLSQIGTFLLIIIILTILAVGFASYSSRRIVAPIKELTETSEEIAKGNLSRTLSGRQGGSSEITTLYSTFQGLLTALRFGNENYYAGNIDKAMDNYQSALELFTSVDNVKGIGICYNNIGNIYRATGDLKQANNYYRKAIDIASELLEKSEDPETKREHYLALASRHNNLGLLYKEIEEFDRALEFISKALEYDMKIDNARGMATRHGNLGQVYLALGDMEKAKTKFDETMEIARSYKNERAMSYALFNYGLYHRATKDYEQSLDYFLQAAEQAKDLDIRVIQSSLINVQEIYEEMGAETQAQAIQKKIEHLMKKYTRSAIYFVIDYSGSMAGKRIRQARNGVEKILKSQVSDEDITALIVFNSSSSYYVQPAPKEKNVKDMMLRLDSLMAPMGGTAFYDALGQAIEQIQKNANSNNWIIALTDGDDNSSLRYDLEKLERIIVTETSINLVIIGVGDLYTKKELQKLCDSTERGRYFNVEQSSDLSIESAFEEVSGMLSEVEVEGFVPDY